MRTIEIGNSYGKNPIGIDLNKIFLKPDYPCTRAQSKPLPFAEFKLALSSQGHEEIREHNGDVAVTALIINIFALNLIEKERCVNLFLAIWPFKPIGVKTSVKTSNPMYIGQT